jgi:hypothetical protein
MLIPDPRAHISVLVRRFGPERNLIRLISLINVVSGLRASAGNHNFCGSYRVGCWDILTGHKDLVEYGCEKQYAEPDYDNDEDWVANHALLLCHRQHSKGVGLGIGG